MKKIKIFFITLFFILTILISTNVQAAGNISLSSSKTNVNVGEEFNVSINLSGMSAATLTVKVGVDTGKVQYISGPSNSSFSNGRAIYTWTDPNGGDTPKTSGTIATFKFRATSEGKATFGVTGDFYDKDENKISPNFSGITVNITKPIENDNTDNNSGESSTPPIKQPETNNNQNTGSSNNNQATSKPQINTNNQQTTTLSSNANLKSLHLNIEGLTPAFNKNVVTYNLVVSDNINNINVNASPEDSNAKVSITGNNNLVTGLNKINIKVTAQNGKNSKTYTINVTKTANLEGANANLENLAIENVSLNPEFSADITNYTAEVDYDIEKLNILAVPQIEGANVQIIGNEDLKVGENVITVTITATDGTTQKAYTLNINKKQQEESNVADIENNVIEVEEDRNGNVLTIVIIIVAVIILVVIGSYIYIRFKK